MGLETDNHLKGQDYSNISMMFYVGFLGALHFAGVMPLRQEARC